MPVGFVFTAICVGGGLLAAEYILRLFVSGRIQQLIENVPPLGIVEPDSDASGETVDIQSEGESLQLAIFRPRSPSAGVVIYCPELHGTHTRAARYLASLVEAGIAVVGIRFRSEALQPAGARPKSESVEGSANQWATTRELADALETISWLKASNEFRDQPIGLFGVSRGGSVALAAAHESIHVEAVACESAFTCMNLTRHFVSRFSRLVLPDVVFRWLPEWHVKAALALAFRRSQRNRGCEYLHIEKMAKRRLPTLLVSGKRDSYVKPGVTADLQRQLGLREDSIWIVPKARHNLARQVAANEYDQRLVAHFRKAFQLPHAQDSDRQTSAA